MNKAAVVIFLFIFSCSNISEYPVKDLNIKTIDVNLEDYDEALNMSEFFSELNYREIQTPLNELVGRVRKVMIQDDLIGFYDEAKQSVWINSKEGEFVNQVSIPRGRGPGELERMSDVIFTDDQLIHALGAFKIVVYDVEGNFIRETNFDFFIYKFTYIRDNDSYVGYAGNSLNTQLKNNHSGKNLLMFDSRGEIFESAVSIPDGRDHMRFTVSNNFPNYSEETLFISHLSDTVYSVQGENVVPKYALDYNQNAIPQDVFDQRGNYSDIPQEWREFREKELNNNDYVMFHFFFNETDSYIHFRVGTDEDYYNVIHDKNKKYTHVGPGKLTNDMNYGFVPFFYESDDNKLYSIIEANELLRHLNEVYEEDREKYSDPKMQELIKLAHSLSDNSNPILQIATFK